MTPEELIKKLEEKRGPLKGLYRLLSKKPSLLERLAALGEQLRFNSSLPKQTLKTIILETAKLHGCYSVYKNHIYPDYCPDPKICALFEEPQPRTNPGYSESDWIEINMTEQFYHMLINSIYAFGIEQPSPRERFVETCQTE